MRSEQAAGPVPTSRPGSSWGSSISLGGGSGGRVTEIPRKSRAGSDRELLLSGTCGAARCLGLGVPVPCREAVRLLSAMDSDRSVTTPARVPSALTENLTELISLPQSRQLSFLQVHWRMQRRQNVWLQGST